MANNRPSDSSSVDNDQQMLPETWSTVADQDKHLERLNNKGLVLKLKINSRFEAKLQ
jgi:hypothetical protein